MALFSSMTGSNADTDPIFDSLPRASAGLFDSTEEDFAALDEDSFGGAHGVRTFYVPITVRISATLCELLAHLTNEEMDSRASGLPLLFPSRRRFKRGVWPEIFSEAREILRTTRLTPQLSPFHVMFPALFPAPLSQPEVLELWVHMIILLHYSITYEAWHGCLKSEHEVEEGEERPESAEIGDVHPLSADYEKKTSVWRFLQAIQNSSSTDFLDDMRNIIVKKHSDTLQVTCVNLIPPQQVRADMPLSRATPKALVTSGTELDREFSSSVELNGLSHASTDTSVTCSAPYMGVRNGPPEDAYQPGRTRVPDIETHVPCFHIFFSGIFGTKNLQPISQGEFHLLERRYRHSLVVDGSVLITVLKARATLTLAFSFIMCAKLQRMALYMHWDREALLPNAKLFMGISNDARRLEFQDPTVRQEHRIDLDKDLFTETSDSDVSNMALVPLCRNDATDSPHDRSTSLPAIILNSSVTQNLLEIIRGAFYDVVLRVAAIDVSRDRTTALISRMNRQGRHKIDATLLRSLNSAVQYPKFVCSADLAIFEKHVLPVVFNADVDPTVAQHLCRLVETLQAPLSFELVAPPSTVTYGHPGEELVLPGRPGSFILCQYLCKGHWRIALGPPGEVLTFKPQSFGTYDYVYIRPDFFDVENNPFLAAMRDVSKNVDWHRVQIVPRVRSAVLYCGATPSAISSVVQTIMSFTLHKGILRYLLIENLFDPFIRPFEAREDASGRRDGGLRILSMKPKGGTDSTKSLPSVTNPSLSTIVPAPIVMQAQMSPPVSPELPELSNTLSPQLITIEQRSPVRSGQNLPNPSGRPRAQTMSGGRGIPEDPISLAQMPITRIQPTWKNHGAPLTNQALHLQENDVISTFGTLKKNGILPVIVFDMMLPLPSCTVTLPDSFKACTRQSERLIKAGLTNIRISLPQSTVSQYSCLCATGTHMTAQPPPTDNGLGPGAPERVTRLLLDYSRSDTWKLFLDELSQIHYKYGISGVLLRGLDYPYFASQRVMLGVKQSLFRKLALDIWTRLPSLVIFAIATDASHATQLANAGIIPIIKDMAAINVTDLNTMASGVQEPAERADSLVGWATVSQKALAGHTIGGSTVPILPFLKEPFTFHSVRGMFVQRPLSLFAVDDIHIRSGLSVQSMIQSMSLANSRVAFYTLMQHKCGGVSAAYTKDALQQQKPCLYTQMQYPVMLDLLSLTTTADFIRHCCVGDTSQTCADGLCYALFREQPGSLTAVISNVGNVRRFCLAIPDACTLLGCKETSFARLSYRLQGMVHMSVGYNSIYDDIIPEPLLRPLPRQLDSVSHTFCSREPSVVNLVSQITDPGSSGSTHSSETSPAVQCTKQPLRSFPSVYTCPDPAFARATVSGPHPTQMSIQDLRNSSFLEYVHDPSIPKIRSLPMLESQWDGALLTAGEIMHGGIVVTAPSTSIFTLRLTLISNEMLRFSPPAKGFDVYPDLEAYSRDYTHAFLGSHIIDQDVNYRRSKMTLLSRAPTCGENIEMVPRYIERLGARATDRLLCLANGDLKRSASLLARAAILSPLGPLLLGAAANLIYGEQPPSSKHAFRKKTGPSGLRSSLLMRSPLGREVAEAQERRGSQATVIQTLDLLGTIQGIPSHILECIAQLTEIPPFGAWGTSSHVFGEAANTVLSHVYPGVRRCHTGEERDSSGLLKRAVHAPDIVFVASRLSNLFATKARLLAEAGYRVAFYAPLYETPTGLEAIPPALGKVAYSGETFYHEDLGMSFGIHYAQHQSFKGCLEVALLHSFDLFHDQERSRTQALNDSECCLSELLLDEQGVDLHPVYLKDDNFVLENPSSNDPTGGLTTAAQMEPHLLPLKGDEGQRFAELSLTRSRVLADYIKSRYITSDGSMAPNPRMLIATPGVGSTAAISVAFSLGSQQVRGLNLTDQVQDHSVCDFEESCGVTSEYTYVSKPKMILHAAPNGRALADYMSDLIGVRFVDCGRIFNYIKHLGIPDNGLLDPFHPYYLYTLRAAVMEFDYVIADADVLNVYHRIPWIQWALTGKDILVSERSQSAVLSTVAALIDTLER
ncbi:hypothetical protein GMRT_14417 [Giardia muris]|uniref:Uncharacterized protein n=1 Tax=Giardia muris TaxID=5742 RepID=A0A4Z1T4Y1_GIAMU|nr:hypothetical protein GMRT_14417 [Giardia muris]|eukprot:TNJ27579.1 hypothetical protein GMRT_14417 [Giardia muris]